MIGELMKATGLALLCAVLLSCGSNAKDNLSEERLIGGGPVSPTDWPVSVFARIGNVGCSATVVGEQALLIASHCTPNGGTAKFSVGPHSYDATCTQHPDYQKNSTADWAICYINEKVEGGPFEVVTTDGRQIEVGTQLLLTGYGCTKKGGKIDGKLRTGLAPVITLPSGTNFDIVTRGRVALCQGDSGGAGYLPLGDKRLIVSVNSRGNIRDTSYLPAIHVDTAQAFLKKWADEHKSEICGITAGAKNCRGFKPPPVLPEDFILDTKIANVSVRLKKEFLSLYDKLKAGMEKLLLDLEPKP